MTRIPEKGVYLTAEQVHAAPPEVRRWLASLPAARADGGGGTVVCNEAEITALLEQLREDELGCQLVFELGCAGIDPNSGKHWPRAVAISEIVRHTDIENGARVLDCVARVNAVLTRMRRDINAQLCVLDDDHLCLDRRTQEAIYNVWRRLIEKAGPEAVRVA
jgi:hypothetical protein